MVCRSLGSFWLLVFMGEVCVGGDICCVCVCGGVVNGLCGNSIWACAKPSLINLGAIFV